MKIDKKVTYRIAAFLLVLFILWFAFMRKAPEKPEKKTVPVEIETVSTGSIEETMELTGWIKANQLVDIASKVPGRVESLSVISNEGAQVNLEEGVEVQKGQQLASIDHDVYLVEVAAAGANLKAAEVEIADAEREKKRMVALYEGGSATEQSKDKAETSAAMAAARLSSARANLELAEINLRESAITSPIDGIVTAKYIDVGNLIKAGDRIVTVADMKTVKLIVAAAERYGEQVLVGMPVRIKVDALPEKVFTAKVYSVYPVLDEQTHTMQIEIRMDNGELLLKPGMFARVILITERKDDVVVISRDVVLGGRIDEPYVYVVEDGTAHKRFVKIGIKQADSCEITDGLKTSEMLVVNGMNYLTDGMKVEVVRLEEIGVDKK
ncbi:MAG: efflux RND transporter periplasmic adaptor subunit [Phycisphaerae bacterium]|nr:efflux RND transporter periplasmic adaptor subunit [Phycisphaerae bacterium]MDD5381189.1 efflux RND transporter periplasmic adaptor subunit [Phycisphaerae bacterium]